MDVTDIAVDEELRRRGIHLKARVIVNVKVAPSPEDKLLGYMREAIKEVLHEGEKITSLKNVKALRRLYWSIGIDPTKTRPSSEALLRRAARGSFPTINNLVDAGNLASLRTQVPIGIYDMERLRPPLRLTWSAGGETFKPIGGEETVLERGLIVLKDREKIIHLFPHRDSLLTAIRPETRKALVVACGAEGIEKKELERALTLTEEYLRLLS